MKNITLLVMAAGMGSRYGGLKQLEAVGPGGETIIDYSAYDAIRAGFNKVVFIIRKDFEQEFTSQITDKYAGKIQVEFAFQDLHDLPDEFTCPEGREKPWGTGHAILTAVDLIHEPFVAINGDDFYGLESFEVVANEATTISLDASDPDGDGLSLIVITSPSNGRVGDVVYNSTSAYNYYHDAVGIEVGDEVNRG